MNRNGRRIALSLVAIVLGAGYLLKIIPPETDVGIDDNYSVSIDGSLISNPLNIDEIHPQSPSNSSGFPLEPYVGKQPFAAGGADSAGNPPGRLVGEERQYPNAYLPEFGGSNPNPAAAPRNEADSDSVPDGREVPSPALPDDAPINPLIREDQPAPFVGTGGNRTPIIPNAETDGPSQTPNPDQTPDQPVIPSPSTPDILPPTTIGDELPPLPSSEELPSIPSITPPPLARGDALPTHQVPDSGTTATLFGISVLGIAFTRRMSAVKSDRKNA